MKEGNSTLCIGSHVQYSNSKHGILCCFVADGEKAIIYDLEAGDFETHPISYLLIYNESVSSVAESMVSMMDHFYNTVDYKARPLENQSLVTSCNNESLFCDEGFLFEDELTTIPIATFFNNSIIYSAFMKSKPVECVNSNTSLNCHSVSVFPCKAIPSEFYYYFCEYSKPVTFTPQTHVYVYTLGSEATRLSIQSPLPSGCFFQSFSHKQSTLIEATSQSMIVDLHEAPVSSFFTFAISPTLSVLSYYIFIREPGAIQQWTSSIHPGFSLFSMLNTFAPQPTLACCQDEVITLSSLLYFYIRSPARIHKDIPAGKTSLTLYLPYLRCFDADVNEMYLQANCFYDDLSLFGSNSLHWISLANRWMEGGGSFIRATDDNPIVLKPTDRILYNQDILSINTYFHTLENCMPSLYMSSGLLISQILSSTKQCYVIAVSLDSLFQLVEYLLTYYSHSLSVITLVYIDVEIPETPSLAFDVEIFNKLACLFRPQLCDTSSPRYFSVLRDVPPPVIQESFDITSTARMVQVNGVFYLCICTNSQEDEIAFYNSMRALNRFYQTMYEIEESVIPPLYQVISHVKQDSSYLDLYLLGPFAKESIQPLSTESPRALAQLLEQFDMLWASGYLVNYMQFLQINGYASFFDTTTLIPVTAIPSIDRQEQYLFYREELSALFTLPEGAVLPSSPSIPQYHIQPVANAVWSILPHTPAPFHPSLDEEPSFVFDSYPDAGLTSSTGRELNTSHTSVTSRMIQSESIESTILIHPPALETSTDNAASILSTLEQAAEEVLPLVQEPENEEQRNASFLANESASDSDEDYAYMFTDSSDENSDDSDLGELICDRHAFYGFTPEQIERIKQLEADQEEKETSFTDLSPSQFQIDAEAADRLFRESMLVQPEEREERVSILKPVVDGEKEEIAGMHVEHEIHRIEDPNVEEEIKTPQTRRVPYHGNENEDIRREVTELSVAESFGLIGSLLSQRVDSIQTIMRGTGRVSSMIQEAEEMPEAMVNVGVPFGWCDMGGSKDD